MGEATCVPDDDSFLDEVLDLAIQHRALGRALDLDHLLSGREHLRARVMGLLEVARDVAPVVAPRLPNKNFPLVAGYTVLGEAGRGGMGIVYRARQETLGRDVALKVLAPGLMASSRARERFVREARALARLRHPHVVTVHEVLERTELCAYAMEWVDGPTLARAIVDHDPRLDVRTVAALGVTLCGALAVVHAAGLVHRDLKPGNILLRRDGTPLLSDFGLVQDSDHSQHTAEGQFVGTAAYAAPEQFRGEQTRVGPRSDVYSLGASLYHALAGTSPFAGSSTTELLRRVASGEWTPLRRVNRRVPVDLVTIVQKAMAPEPELRYARAQELGADLERFLRFEPVHARPAGWSLRLVRWVERRPSLAFALGGLVLSLVLGLVLALHLLRRAQEERDTARRREYSAAMAAAEGALRANDVSDARAHLDRAPVEFRHWEWRYLHSRLDRGWVLGRHRDEVCGLAVHPQGDRLATASMDRTVRVWSAETGVQLYQLDLSDSARAVAWSGDGASLVVVSEATVSLWDGSTGRPQVGYRVGDPACALAVRTDGLVAVGHQSGRIGLHTLAGLLGATGSRPSADAHLPPASRVLEGRRMNRLVFSPRGWLASATGSGVEMWDVESGGRLAEFPIPGNSFGLAVHPDGNRLAVSGNDAVLRVFEVEKRTEVAAAYGHSGRTQSVAWSPDGTQLLSASYDRTIRLWTERGVPVATFGGHSDTVRCVAFLGADRFASTGGTGRDASVRIWTTQDPEDERRTRFGYRSVFVDLDPLARWLVYETRSQAWAYVILGHLATRRVEVCTLYREPAADRGAPVPTAVSRDGTRLAIGANGGVLVFAGDELALRAGAESGPAPGHVLRVAEGETAQILAFGDTADTLAAGDATGVVTVWDVAARQARHRFRLPGEDVLEMAIDPTGRLLAAATRACVAVWDLGTGQLVTEQRELRRVNGLAFHPDGHVLAVAHVRAGPVISLLGTASWREHGELRGHTDVIERLAFSPDGQRLASSSRDRTVRLWDPESGMAALTLHDHNHSVRCVRWTGDGAWLLSSTSDATIRFRHAPTTGAAR